MTGGGRKVGGFSKIFLHVGPYRSLKNVSKVRLLQDMSIRVSIDELDMFYREHLTLLLRVPLIFT